MPEFAVLLGWVLVGWYCGTPFPHYPPSPIHPPAPIHPPNPSDPVPHPPVPIGPGPWWQRWAVFGVLGAVGGVVGGYVFGQLFNVDYGEAAGILLSFAGTFVGARLFADVGGALVPMGGRRA
jgi:hypothetical protein